MMGSKRMLAAVLILLASVPRATRGQIPSLPSMPSGVPAIPGASGLGSAIPGVGGLGGASALGGLGGASALGGLGGASALGGAAGASPQTLWGFLGLSKGNLAACKAKICASPIGQMLNSGLAPYSSMTGGLVPQCCPTVPSAAQAAALAAANGPTSAEAVAAKIKQDEADAPARRAAVRYLGTVACHYWPEAEAALIGSLRDDRNECVRYEAALSLLNGCCCTKKTIEALNIVVSGGDKDGKPSETSERVRSVAFSALQKCLVQFHEPAAPAESPEQPERLEPVAGSRPIEPLPPGFRRLAYYYVTIEAIPLARVVADARRTVARPEARRPASTLLTGQHSVYHALALAAAPPARPSQAVAAPAQAAAPPADGTIDRTAFPRAAPAATRPAAPAARPTPAGPPARRPTATTSRPHSLRDVLLGAARPVGSE